MAININGTLNNYNYLLNNSATRRQNSIEALWSNYGNFNNNAASNAGVLTEIRQNSDAVINSYNEARDTFYTEFDSDMYALKESANTLKNTNFNVGENAITKTDVTDEDGNVLKDEDGNTLTKTTYSKTMQSALDAVKNLVDDYNESIKFFKDNSSVSNRVAGLASTFGDTSYRSSLYEQVGISVGKDGTLSIDEERLANSIVENPDKVSRILGKGGLADKAIQHVDNANAQREYLFPSAKAMIGKQLDQAAVYTGKSMLNINNIANIGNLVNMMF